MLLTSPSLIYTHIFPLINLLCAFFIVSTPILFHHDTIMGDGGDDDDNNDDDIGSLLE